MVTVTGKDEPVHEPAVETGVTLYTILPSVVLLGLISTWLIDEPELADAPEILPVLVPNVQLKLLGILAVRAIPEPVPLHIALVAELVTEGKGFTVKVTELLLAIAGVAQVALLVILRLITSLVTNVASE